MTQYSIAAEWEVGNHWLRIGYDTDFLKISNNHKTSKSEYLEPELNKFDLMVEKQFGSLSFSNRFFKELLSDYDINPNNLPLREPLFRALDKMYEIELPEELQKSRE